MPEQLLNPNTTTYATALMQLGAVGLILWWLTLKLVPQLQRERTEAIAAFKDESEKQRILHQTIVERMVDNNERAVDGLLDHIRAEHAR